MKKKAKYIHITATGKTGFYFNDYKGDSGDGYNYTHVYVDDDRISEYSGYINEIYLLKGAKIYICMTNEKYVGKGISVNGEILPVPSHDSYDTIPGCVYLCDKDIVIEEVTREQLTDFEKENFIPITKLSENCSVRTKPNSNYHSDELDEGDCILRDGQTKYDIYVPFDYAKGGSIIICGEEVVPEDRGYDWLYIGDYIIPDNANEFTLELKQSVSEIPDDPETPNVPETPDIPQTPDIPAAPVIPSAPSIPFVPSAPVSSPAAPVSGVTNTSDKTVVKNKAPTASSIALYIKRAKNADLQYNARAAGITGNIIKAFYENKKAMTLTAEFEGFEVVIDKSDINSIKSARKNNIKVLGNEILTQKQISKFKPLDNAQKLIQINFSDSELKGISNIAVKVSAGTEYSGSSAGVYELQGRRLHRTGTVNIDKNGMLTFKTDYTGKFIIVIE